MNDVANGAKVCIVDDDADARFGLKLLLESAGHTVEAFASAEDFLVYFDPGSPTCLILDLQMPAIDGLDLQKRLRKQARTPPIIFLTGHGSVPSAVEALKQGAVDFFQKPVADDQLLLDRIAEAIRQDMSSIAAMNKRNRASELLSQLTTRETEVMNLICQGKANKVIAIDLGISERTVELHRGHMMRKLGVRSVPELIELKSSLT